MYWKSWKTGCLVILSHKSKFLAHYPRRFADICTHKNWPNKSGQENESGKLLDRDPSANKKSDPKKLLKKELQQSHLKIKLIDSRK